MLSIIIINYKTPELTLRCIESIYASVIDVSFEVIVVDNDSQDNSKELVSSQYPQIKWVDNDYNAGFGRANNKGLEQTSGKYILFLNSDMLLNKNTLEICLKEIAEDHKIGVLSCVLFNEDGSEQRSRFYHVLNYKEVLKRNLFIDKLYKFKNEEIKAVIGAFMLIPKAVLDKVGGFDPDFFMYSEELELCKRIRDAGYTIAQTQNTSAIHKHGGSTTSSNWSLKQKFVSNLLMYRKVHGFFGYLLFNLVFIFNSITNFFLMWLLDKNYRKAYWNEQKLYLFSLKYLFVLCFWNSRKSNDFLKVEL